MKKKVILFIFIVIIVGALGYLGYSYLFNNKVTINYSLKDAKEDKMVIRLDVDSNKGIKEIILPDGSIKEYDNKKDINLDYLVDENGDYVFTIVYNDGKREDKTITVDKMNSKNIITTTKKTTTTTKKSTKINTIKTTTKKVTTTTKKLLSGENRLKTLSVLSHDITLTDDVYEYYYYYSGTDYTPNILYTTKSDKVSSTINSNEMVVGDNLYNLVITAEDGSKATYKIHVVKYEVDITFSNLITLSNSAINTKIDTGLTSPLNEQIESIEYALSSSPISPLVTNSEYVLYDDSIGVNILETAYVYVKVTTKDGNVFTKTSSLYTIDSVKPVINDFAGTTNYILGGNDGLVESANVVVNRSAIGLNRTGYVATSVADGYNYSINIREFSFKFIVLATDNYSSSLKYSFSEDTKAIDANSTWSDWNTSNEFTTISINPYDGNNYYFGFRVMDEAGNISDTIIYMLPTFKKSIGIDECYYMELSALNSLETNTDVVLLVKNKDDVIGAVNKVGNIYYNNEMVSNPTEASNICIK